VFVTFGLPGQMGGDFLPRRPFLVCVQVHNHSVRLHNSVDSGLHGNPLLKSSL
jgi:hypothetical protein